MKCLWAIKFSPENLEGENSLTRERLSVIVIESLECVSVTSPEYPLTKVSTLQNTAHGKDRTTGFTNPVALDQLSFEAIHLPISFK